MNRGECGPAYHFPNLPHSPRFTLVAERVHDLSREGDAQREAMWNVEVPEAFKTLEAAHAAGI